MARPSWDIADPSWDKLEKEAVVSKEFKHLRRIGRSYRPIGPLLRTDMANWVFFYPTEVAYRGFPPLTQLQGFLYINYKFSPYNGVVYMG